MTWTRLSRLPPGWQSWPSNDGGEGGEQESATRGGVHRRGPGQQAPLRDLSGHRDRDLAPPMGEVDVEGALDVGGVLGIHSDTDGV